MAEQAEMIRTDGTVGEMVPMCPTRPMWHTGLALPRSLAPASPPGRLPSQVQAFPAQTSRSPCGWTQGGTRGLASGPGLGPGPRRAPWLRVPQPETPAPGAHPLQGCSPSTFTPRASPCRERRCPRPRGLRQGLQQPDGASLDRPPPPPSRQDPSVPRPAPPGSPLGGCSGPGAGQEGCG